MPTATAASGATCGQKINAAKGLINDNVDVNDNLAAPLLAKAAPQRLVASGE